MKLKVCWIGKTKEAAIASLTAEYLKRMARYIPSDAHELPSEEALLTLMEKLAARTRPILVLLDQRGRQFTSEEFAELLSAQQERGAQNVIFAIGPADGFAQSTRDAADLVVSFGKMTLSHELARVVLLEQLYRAFTILKGHPYHAGHK